MLIVKQEPATAYLYVGVHDTNRAQHSVCVNRWKNVSVRWKELELHPVPEGFMVLPEDLFTHLGDFENACGIAVEASMNHDDEELREGDVSYWQHQLETIRKIKAQIEAHYGKPDNSEV